MTKFFWILLAMLLSGACGSGETLSLSMEDGGDAISLPPRSSAPEYGGSTSFKVPVPQGYDWEVTQSWASHCNECDAKYSDWDYCTLSHQSSCCKYGIDFNLPGTADLGKPVLASSAGTVKAIGSDGAGWGYYVVIDHGQNICTRSSHMLQGSTSHLVKGAAVCQGMKIGEVGNTGASGGPHLHFQFESCDTQTGLARGFSDGNGVLKCVRGNDRYDQYGNYSAMMLTNVEVQSCASSSPAFGGGELPDGGWLNAACGTLPGCPLIPGCGRQGGHQFGDYSSTEPLEAKAASYLWSECAIDGINGLLKPTETITRAEALKISLFLFGLKDNCNGFESFSDVGPTDWFYPVVLCGLKHGVISSEYTLFRPNEKASIAEASKMVVEAAAKAGVISIKNPSTAHFSNIGKTHWAYSYVETLLSYGGLLTKHTSFNPNTPVQRGDFALMAASMSPCFCSNVSCGGGCACDQEVFACVDPNDTSGGTGGTNPPTCVPSCYGKDCGNDGCGGSCGGCPYNHNCESNTCVPIPCQAATTCEDLGTECGYVSDNCNEWINCGDCDSDDTCQDGQCVSTNCADCGGCPSSAPEINGLCVMDGWFCDPFKGYEINLYSPGGSYKVQIANGPIHTFSGILGPAEVVTLNFSCKQFPVAILLEGGPMDTVVTVEDELVADFVVWADYTGQIFYFWTDSPTAVTKEFYWPSPNSRFLIGIPVQYPAN